MEESEVMTGGEVEEENAEGEKKKSSRFHIKKPVVTFFIGLLVGLGILVVVVLILNPDMKEIEILSLIKKYAITDATDEDLENGKYDGILSALGDKYADYYTAEETNSNTEKRSGSYEGIGLVVGEQDDGSFIISGVYSDSPASEAGVEAGDIIIRVGDTSVVNESYVGDDNADDGTTLSALLQLIADQGDDVKITVKRDENEIDFAMTPREISLNSVNYKMEEDNIGFIRIEKFNKTTGEQFDEAITELTNQGMRALIVDLRNNGGGLVDVTKECLERILPEGLMFYTETKDGTRTEYSAKGETPLEVPMAILVNGSTASASEIFAGACRDQLGAILVGETTYGKGIIQTTTQLSDGSSVKFTTAHYFTPNGTDLNGVGLSVDVESTLEVEDGVTQIEAGSDGDSQYLDARNALVEKMK